MGIKKQINAKNNITAITYLAVPDIQYSFGIIKYSRKEEIRQKNAETT